PTDCRTIPADRCRWAEQTWDDPEFRIVHSPLSGVDDAGRNGPTFADQGVQPSWSSGSASLERSREDAGNPLGANNMSLDERIALTLYDRMFEVITGSDPDAGLPSPFNTNETMFVMAAKGMVLKASDFANPWSPGNLTGSVDAAANIAAL